MTAQLAFLTAVSFALLTGGIYAAIRIAQEIRYGLGGWEYVPGTALIIAIAGFVFVASLVGP